MINGIDPIGRPSKLAGQIAGRLREMIASGALQPNDKLPTERELCGAFGVGRSSVREALQSLEYLGLVDSRAGIGRFLSANAGHLLDSLNWGQVVEQASAAELMEVRRQLEVMAARLAAGRASEPDLVVLDGLLCRMRGQLDEPDEFLATELGFHLALARACGNSVLAELVALLIQKVAGQAEQFMRTLPYTLDATLRQLERVLLALQDGDEAAAGASMQEHLDLVSGVLVRGLGEAPDEAANPGPACPPAKAAQAQVQRSR